MTKTLYLIRIMLRIAFVFSSLALILILFKTHKVHAFCAPTQNVNVVVTSKTDCLTVTSMSVSCSSDTELTLTNNCGIDIIGIEHQSLNRNIPDGYPPLEPCIQPWLEAVSTAMEPPLCVLVHGGVAKASAQGDEKLIFDLNGESLTIELELIHGADDTSDNPPISDENKGCSMINELPLKGLILSFLMIVVLYIIKFRKTHLSY